jgi:hypothetical protein
MGSINFFVSSFTSGREGKRQKQKKRMDKILQAGPSFQTIAEYLGPVQRERTLGSLDRKSSHLLKKIPSSVSRALGSTRQCPFVLGDVILKGDTKLNNLATNKYYPAYRRECAAKCSEWIHELLNLLIEIQNKTVKVVGDKDPKPYFMPIWSTITLFMGRLSVGPWSLIPYKDVAKILCQWLSKGEQIHIGFKSDELDRIPPEFRREKLATIIYEVPQVIGTKTLSLPVRVTSARDLFHFILN